MKFTTTTVAALLIALATLTASAATNDGTEPPPQTTGVINPKVTQANIGRTICVSGWTGTIRPSSSYTDKLKKEQLAALGYADQNPAHYEEDHRVPLEVGGHPRDPKNLYPELRSSDRKCDSVHITAECKDNLENFVHREVCAKRMTLKEGQAIFLGDWMPAYRKYLGHHAP